MSRAIYVTCDKYFICLVKSSLSYYFLFLPLLCLVNEDYKTKIYMDTLYSYALMLHVVS